MKLTQRVKRILANYESDTPGTKANIARILMNGRLGGSGRLVVLPVDQGWEHGPARSFAPNPPAYDPHYHYQLAIDAGLSAYAAPLGFPEAGADTFAGAIPTILKLNSANSLNRDKDAARSSGDGFGRGCAPARLLGHRFHDLSRLRCGIRHDRGRSASWPKRPSPSAWRWSSGPIHGVEICPRPGETAIDIVAYAAHIAAQLGAHIIKVKPPTAHLELEAAKKVYEAQNIDVSTLAARVRHIMQAAFEGRRLVVFSGGEAKDLAGFLRRDSRHP